MNKRLMIIIQSKVGAAIVTAAVVLIVVAMRKDSALAAEVTEDMAVAPEEVTTEEFISEEETTEEDEGFGEFYYHGHYEGEEVVDPDGEYDDPLGQKARLASLPESPNQFLSADDLLDYYRLTNKEVGIYDLKPGKVYYMSYHPMNFSAFVKNDYFISIDKVWEQKRGGLFGVFGDFTKRTIQYRDMITGEVCYNRPLSADLRFYELEKIKQVTDPSLRNQF